MTKQRIVKWMVLWAGVVITLQGAQANNCDSRARCNDCIQTPGCMWCSNIQTSETDRVSHCNPIESSNSFVCADEHLESPVNKVLIMKNETLSSPGKLQPMDSITQLAPQAVKLKLRRGTSEKITLTYRQAAGYPIDLYYLMDLSNSMRDDKQQLALLGNSLTATLQNLTSQFRIGFGSFVDKVMVPFVDMHPKKLLRPCIECAKPYSFRNDLPLGINGSLFSERVREAEISGNLDSPEGGFDALMQVLVCKDKIGWKDQARKIVVFSTDETFHHAGDGKLAGLVTPNDEKCHLDAAGEYDAYDQFDYPSIGQINKMSKEKDIYIIFAVLGHEDVYKELSELLEHSSYGKLSSSSSNIVELVRDQYNKISSIVSLTDNSSNAISIRYSSNCRDSSAPPTTTKQCQNMREGDEVTFTLEVELNDCPAGIDREMVEVKTLQDTLILDLQFYCSCGCEKEAKASNTSQAKECNNRGALVCGVCNCVKGYQGEKCSCSLDGDDEEESYEEKCKATPDDEVCSSNGYCKCGICYCSEKKWSGKFCECDQEQCLTQKGKICSGHGTCNCSQCSCHISYEGELCECHESACIHPGTLVICSGHGECNCGQCDCLDDYQGKYCEDCLSCKEGQCLKFVEDVLCHFREHTPGRCKRTVIKRRDLKEHQENQTLNTRSCSFVDVEDGCQILFNYLYENVNKSYVIYVQEEKDCPTDAPILIIMMTTLGTVVLIGMVTLFLWKLFTTLHDQREYAKFEEERKKTLWKNRDNPLYKNPTVNFVNPAFSRQQAHDASQEAEGP